MLETPALEVYVTLLSHIPRQVPALRRQMRLECGIVFLDELIKEGALRAATQIRWRAATRTGFPVSRRRQHDRILAIQSFYASAQQAVALTDPISSYHLVRGYFWRYFRRLSP